VKEKIRRKRGIQKNQGKNRKHHGLGAVPSEKIKRGKQISKSLGEIEEGKTEPPSGKRAKGA